MKDCKYYKVILTGTDPTSKKGGIGFALPGYIAALKSSDIAYVSIPTYSPNSFFGKYLLFIFTLPQLFFLIRKSIDEGVIPIVYSHAGGGLSLFREGIVTLFSRACGAKTVMHIHSFSTIKYLKSFKYRPFFILATIGVQRFFLLTPWWKTRYVELGVKKKINVIPNPLPSEWEDIAQRSLGVSECNSKINLLVMTRVVKGKGVDKIINSAPYLSDDFRINIAGDGSLISLLKEQTKELKQENKVKFLGWVDGKRKQTLLDESTIFCHLTTFDAMPMNIVEAMANGLPIIALDWGAIPDLVPNKVAGFLLDTGEPKEVAATINLLLDSQLRKVMGAEAKKWVLKNYSSRVVGQDMSKIFSRMVGK